MSLTQKGGGTTASGWCSHAGGYFTIANQPFQTAIGTYNAIVSDALFIVGNGNSTDRSNAMYVTTAGNINCVSVTQTSDKRLKDNISNLTTTDMAIFDALKPKSFTLKSDTTNARHYGLIAQDVISTFENLGLPTSYTSFIHQDANETGYYNLNYIELIALMIQKQKDMQSEIDELKSIIAHSQLN